MNPLVTTPKCGGGVEIIRAADANGPGLVRYTPCVYEPTKEPGVFVCQNCGGGCREIAIPEWLKR